MRALILNCWAPKPATRMSSQALVDIITEVRSDALEYDLDQEFEEARKEGLELRVLKDWTRRARSEERYARPHVAELIGTHVGARQIPRGVQDQPRRSTRAHYVSIGRKQPRGGFF